MTVLHIFYPQHCLDHTLKHPSTLQHRQVGPLLQGPDGRHDQGLGDLVEFSFLFYLESKDGGSQEKNKN